MNNQIPRYAYLRHARDLTTEERRLIQEFSGWLPQSIIDCHAHCNLSEHVKDVDDRSFRHMLSTFPYFNLEDSKAWNALMHPKQSVRTLRFPKTFRGIDHRAANHYLLEQSPTEDRVALYGLPQDVDYTTQAMEHPRVSALKMYYAYLEPPATKVYEYFPRSILEVAQARAIPIILHPPTNIVACLQQLLDLVHDFPRLRICLAHLGLIKSLIPGLGDAFRALAKRETISFDSALVPSGTVVAEALAAVGPSRIMFGSDAPLHLIRSVPYVHPERGERIVSEYPYHWLDAEEHRTYKHLARGATHAHWQALQALREGISTLAPELQESTKRQIFHDNAKYFYGF